MCVRPVAAAAILWAAFVVALEIEGTWQLLGGEVPAVAAFACVFTLLTYALDAEARCALERLSPRALLVAALASVAIACAAPRAVGLLVALPALAILAVALVRRAARSVFVSSKATGRLMVATSGTKSGTK